MDFRTHLFSSTACRLGSFFSKSSAQSALRKLAKHNLIIPKGHGVWELADNMMRDWILKNTVGIDVEL